MSKIWVGPGGINIFGKMSQFEELQLNGNNIEGKVDKMALPPFEEHKLCQPTSHAQFQITLRGSTTLLQLFYISPWGDVYSMAQQQNSKIAK